MDTLIKFSDVPFFAWFEALIRRLFCFTWFLQITQLIFTCSKSTIEAVGKGVNYVQS